MQQDRRVGLPSQSFTFSYPVTRSGLAGHEIEGRYPTRQKRIDLVGDPRHSAEVLRPRAKSFSYRRLRALRCRRNVDAGPGQLLGDIGTTGHRARVRNGSARVWAAPSGDPQRLPALLLLGLPPREWERPGASDPGPGLLCFTCSSPFGAASSADDVARVHPAQLARAGHHYVLRFTPRLKSKGSRAIVLHRLSVERRPAPGSSQSAQVASLQAFSPPSSANA